MPDVGRLNLLERLWWVRLPVAAARLSSGLAQTLLDGSGLLAIPPLAMLLPPAAAAAGLAIGASHVTFATSFTESLVVLALAAAMGVTSAHAGLLFLLGFAAGDFFIFNADWTAGRGFSSLRDAPLSEHLAAVRVPLVISYGVLSLLVVGIPLTAKGILGQLRFPARLSPDGQFRLALAAFAALVGGFTFFWTQAAAIMIRPLATWANRLPGDAAFAPLQNDGILVVVVAVMAALARIVLQRRGVPPGPASQRMDALERALRQHRRATPPLTGRLPTTFGAVARGLWATLLLAGLYFDWLDAILMGAILLAFTLARGRVLDVPLGRWPVAAGRIPVLLRLGLAVVIIFAVGNWTLDLLTRSETFRPLVVITGISLAIFFILIPPRPQERSG